MSNLVFGTGTGINPFLDSGIQMLKRLSYFSALLFLLTSVNGCLYSKVTRPLDRDVEKTELGSKIGRSKSRSIAFLIAWGDSGVAAAAHQGGLKTVNHLDMESFVLLFGLYSEVTTIAYGD